MEKYRIYLHLFDEEGASTVASTDTVAEATTESAEGSAEVVKTSEQLSSEFDGFIKGEYKQQYDERVQKAIKDRFKKYDGMEGQLKNHKALATILAQKYGTDDPVKLHELLSNDNSLYEEEALQKGISVENLKDMKRLEYENAQLREEQNARIQEEQNKQKAAELWEAAAPVKEKYPSFDLQMEMQNPRFADLVLGGGVDMQTAYEVIHHDEIMYNFGMQTAQAVAQQQATNANIRAKRPAENGLGSNPGVVTKFDVNKMTVEEMMDMARRAKRGEVIPL